MYWNWMVHVVDLPKMLLQLNESLRYFRRITSVLFGHVPLLFIQRYSYIISGVPSGHLAAKALLFCKASTQAVGNTQKRSQIFMVADYTRREILVSKEKRRLT